MTALEARSISKAFVHGSRQTVALCDLDLGVVTGEWIAVMGPSGCGKSTLLNLLGGLDVPDSGEIFVRGTPMHGMSESARARLRRHHIGYVFQQYNLLHGLDVRANVELPCLLVGMTRRAARQRAAELLERLGLADALRMAPAELSGGEQQRVAVARALANSPTVLLADEPTGSLDSESARAVVDLLRAEHGQGQTIVMVTHDHRVAARGDRVLVMHDGLFSDERRLDSSSNGSYALANLVPLDALS